MDYSKYSRKSSMFKRPRRPSLFYRYPRLMHYSLLGLAGLVFFSKPLYDIFFGPPTVSIENMSLEEIRELRKRSSTNYIPPFQKKE